MLKDQSANEPSGPRISGLISVVLIFSVFSNILMLTGPLFMLQVYDRVLASRSQETLVALFGLVAVLYLYYILIEYARGRVAARAGGRIQSAFDSKVFSAVIEDTASGGERHKRYAPLSALSAVRLFFTSPVFLALMDLPWTPLFLLCIFIFHPVLGWVATAGAFVLVITAVVNQVMTYKKVQEANMMSARADQFAARAQQGGEYVWAQGMSNAMVQRWQHLRSESLRSAVRSADWTGSFSSFTRGFRLLLQSAILATGAWLVLQNEVTAGAMIASSILMGRALQPVDQAIGNWQVVQNARSGWTRLKSFLQDTPEHIDTLELPRPKAQLSVNNVTVISRPGEKPLLHAVGFSVAPGEALGVIGKSGSGKTTLARVVMGIVRPNAGDVRLHGSKLEHFGSDRLGLYVGYLPQNVSLFDGSIAENIAQMDVEPDPEKVVSAAKKARVHDVIQKLPDGYDTKIGDAGTWLSGGQRQRLALARALYRDPVILVLDEPNSALDAEGSEALNTVVREMKEEGKAVVIMTHRPTAISCCDSLLILEEGKVKAYGPRDEIIRKMMQNAEQVQSVVSRKQG